MSTHLLTPLMELNEDSQSPFLSSYQNLQPNVSMFQFGDPQEYVWCDVEVTTPDGKAIVNSRIGSVNNTKGLYAIVGPIGMIDQSNDIQVLEHDTY